MAGQNRQHPPCQCRRSGSSGGAYSASGPTISLPQANIHLAPSLCRAAPVARKRAAGAWLAAPMWVALACGEAATHSAASSC